MLIDFFAFRYQDVQLWDKYSEETRRFFFQATRLILDELFPQDYGDYPHRTRDTVIKVAFRQHCMELGYNDPENLERMPNVVLRDFLQDRPADFQNKDEFIKSRVSLIELIFRYREVHVENENASLPTRLIEAKERDGRRARAAMGLPSTTFEAQTRNANDLMNRWWNEKVDELNVRSARAGLLLSYHAHFFQLTGDKLVEERIRQPFWRAIDNPIWSNVEIDMLEALDTNDKNGRDPSLYASKALESTLKIIADTRGFARGNEIGASQFAQSLRLRGFIDQWEEDAITDFFRKVRNPHGHGPGNQPMPQFNSSQNEWAIEVCMSWIKSLVGRY